MGYVIDTSFLVGLWRGRGAGAEGAFLSAHPDVPLQLPWVARGEFLAGAAIAGHAPDSVREFLGSFAELWPDARVVQHYAEAYAALRLSGVAIDANDLWIAATALAVDRPVVTRNTRDFARVPGLRVIDYTKPPL